MPQQPSPATPAPTPPAGRPESPPQGGAPASWPAPVIPSFRELRDYLAEDYAANRRGFWEPGFQAVAAYRIGVWCNGIGHRLLRLPVRALSMFLLFFCRNFYGIELSSRGYIGRRLRIAHQHGISVHPLAVIGNDAFLHQGVTIGATGQERDGGRFPVLGDRVQVGVGAAIVGPVTIGDDVSIGPNAVVITDVAPGSIVAPPRARIMTPPPRRRPGETTGETAAETAP